MHQEHIDQRITAQVRFSGDGMVQPTAFVWQERTRYLAGLGRQWTETVDGAEWRCFLAHTTGGDTVELRWNTQTHEWRLWRAWWREQLA